MTEAKHRGAEDERSSAVWVNSGPEENRVMRQAFAGMLWGIEYYAYNVARWLDGDPGQPTPTPSRLSGRNSRWRHVDAADILPSSLHAGWHSRQWPRVDRTAR